MPWYCDIAPGNPYHAPYHDREYGFPASDERVLFERLSLEIFQAGLSWLTVLKKRAAMNAAFDGFVVDKVARYGAREKKRLLADPGIIRNRLKVDAIIDNAKRVQELRTEGGFSAWLEARHPLSKDDWVKLFRKTFRFTGGEITGEFLLSLGYLPCPHRPDCPAYARIVKLRPAWSRKPGSRAVSSGARPG